MLPHLSGVPQWRIQGRGPGGPPPSYCLTKMRPEEPKKFFLETGPPSYLRVCMTAPPPPPPYLKVWIRHCNLRSGPVLAVLIHSL